MIKYNLKKLFANESKSQNISDIFPIYCFVVNRIEIPVHLHRMERLVLSTVTESRHFFNKFRSRFSKYLLVVLRRNRLTYVTKCVVASCAGETFIFSNTSIVFNTVAISVTWNVIRTTTTTKKSMPFAKIFSAFMLLRIERRNPKIPCNFDRMISTNDPIIPVRSLSWKTDHHPW